MSERLELTLPMPPSSNNLYASIGRRRVLSISGRAYVQAVADALREQPDSPRFRAGRLRLHLTLYPPTRHRRDISNYVKCLEDSLVKACVMSDDSQVDELHVTRGPVSPPGSCVVVLEVLP